MAENTKNNKKEKLTDLIDVEKILATGQVAEIKLYQDYIRRIGNGEKLKSQDIKHFNKLGEKLGQFFNGSPEEKPDAGKIKSVSEAIEYLGISKQRLSYHVTRGNLRQNIDGSFDVLALDEWQEKYLRKQKNKKLNLTERRERAELRIKVAQARRHEIVAKQLADELLSKKEVYEGWASRVAILVRRLDNLVERLPPILEHKPRDEIAMILRDEIYRLRMAYATKSRYCPEVEEKN